MEGVRLLPLDSGAVRKGKKEFGRMPFICTFLKKREREKEGRLRQAD